MTDSNSKKQEEAEKIEEIAQEMAEATGSSSVENIKKEYEAVIDMSRSNTDSEEE
jgi:hypothetical protein